MKKLTISLLALITILSCGVTTVSAARFRTYRYHTPRVRRTPRYRIRKSEYSYSHKMSSDYSSYGHHARYRHNEEYTRGYNAGFEASQQDKKEGTTAHQILSSDESAQHTRYYLRGYKEGYRDGMNR